MLLFIEKLHDNYNALWYDYFMDININLHDFWNVYDGVDTKHETQNFVKNLGIFAGLLLLAAVNIDERKKG